MREPTIKDDGYGICLFFWAVIVPLYILGGLLEKIIKLKEWVQVYGFIPARLRRKWFLKRFNKRLERTKNRTQ